MYKWLLYITNNLEKSKHEKEWDIAIVIMMTLAIVIAEYQMLLLKDYAWAAGMLIWYLQAIDQMRHNRE